MEVRKNSVFAQKGKQKNHLLSAGQKVAFFCKSTTKRCKIEQRTAKIGYTIRSFTREAYIICAADIIASAISSVTAGNGYH